MNSSALLVCTLQPAGSDEAFDSALVREPRISYLPGQTLAQAIYLSGYFSPPALCSGLGRCGRCRVRIIAQSEGIPPPLPEDAAFFSQDALNNGWRLGCRHIPYTGMRVELPASACSMVPPIMPGASTENLSIRPDRAGVGAGVEATPGLFLAVDLGTTSMQWHLLGKGGESLHKGSMLNPQMGAGSDVISRLTVAATPQGAALLRQRVVSAIQGYLQSYLEAAPDLQGEGVVICLAANPAMTCIALGKTTTSLAVAPYALPYRGGDWQYSAELPPVWIPPQLSPFVGGDISAGYAALATANLLQTGALSSAAEEGEVVDLSSGTGEGVVACVSAESKGERGGIARGCLAELAPGGLAVASYPFLLADMGTNGEFLLALSPRKTLVASVALGPALEGIGLRFGTEARTGAVTAFSFSPRGLVATLYNNEKVEPIGITGTGYLSLVHQLLKIGAISRLGHFTPTATPLAAKIFASPHVGEVRAASNRDNSKEIGDNRENIQTPQEPFLLLPDRLYLTATDVEEILKVKAAFSLGLRCLLSGAGIETHALQAVYLAGSLGAHVDTEALEYLGFFPQGLRSRIIPVGNTSLAGAELLAQSPVLRQALVAWSKQVQGFELTSNKDFQQGFAEHMRFFW